MQNTTTRLSHIEINVSDYAKSIRFYDMILFPLGWERLVCTTDCKTYSDGFLKLILSLTEERFKEIGFHRKRIGLNHLALYAFSQKEVDSYYKDVLVANNISSLYQEGPDRMKIEITYAPCYCKKESWPNNIESNFDPYKL